MPRKHDSDSESDDDCESMGVVRVSGSKVYYTGDITEENVTTLIQELKKLEKKLLKLCIDYEGFNPSITLYINSYGGSVFAGLSAMDHIESSKVPITTVADGMCASAATFMLLGGSKRLMKKSAYILIHQLSAGMWGDFKFEELKEELENNKKIMKSIINLYEKKTNIPSNKLEKLMKKDIFLNRKRCIKYDIVSACL